MLESPQLVIDRLREFQRAVRDVVIESRKRSQMFVVSRHSSADTIYQIDTMIEPILEDFCRDWSKTTPLVLIAEGVESEGFSEGIKAFPEGTPVERAAVRLIVDPIDGTRGIMYDKRAAWALAGVAPNKGDATRLSDMEVAVMTELPTSKMGFGDILWAIRGSGATGRRVDLSSGEDAPLQLHPSTATNIDHGFASVSNFFPGTKVLASELMEHLARQLVGDADVMRSAVFDDQYISTGGQFYELIVGHDRFNADLRPVFYEIQKQSPGLCCHPYDCAAMLVAQEAGIILTDAKGNALDGPMDVTTGLSWAGYANTILRKKIEPLLMQFLQKLRNNSGGCRN
jgi:fructose-1,6-bisphosphatase/inositol monophosphatase family enzyme